MKFGNWGNSLAVRLAANLARKLCLKRGNYSGLNSYDNDLEIARHPSSEEIFVSLRQFRGRLSGKTRLTRDKANAP
ncbi:MAG: hypothetical protein RIR04_1928 [Pseudomonadota bacterium]|jgi:antitoxin MazE